jgi:heterogeneous nuclear ribonucleoprotein A1/A3
LLSDLKVDGAGEAEGEVEASEGQDDFTQDDLKDEDEPDKANKSS